MVTPVVSGFVRSHPDAADPHDRYGQNLVGKFFVDNWPWMNRARDILGVEALFERVLHLSEKCGLGSLRLEGISIERREITKVFGGVVTRQPTPCTTFLCSTDFWLRRPFLLQRSVPGSHITGTR